MHPLLHIPATLRDAIAEDSRARYPHEACGILLGRVADARVVVEQAIPTANLSPTPLNHYIIDPRAQLAAERDSTAERYIVGFYHSHPNAPAVPSARDLAEGWEGYVYLIVSICEGRPPEHRAWSIPLPGATFCEIATMPS